MNTNAPNTNQQEPVRITIIFPTNAYFMSGIRELTFSMIKNMTSFPEQWAYRMQSVVDELCNNAIEHGSAPLKEVKVAFIHNPQENSIEIVVEDSGTGDSKLKAAEMQKLLVERKKPGFAFTAIRGRGLPKIVSEWTDEMYFTDLPNGGLQVRVKKYLTIPASEGLAPAGKNDPTHLVLTI